MEPPAVVGARRHRRQRRGGDECIDGAAAASCEFQLSTYHCLQEFFHRFPL